MTDDEYLYCDECGCEIRSKDDLGFEGLREERGCGLAATMVEVPFYICRSCTDEEEQAWEDFQETPEYQYECAFMAWAKEQTT